MNHVQLVWTPWAQTRLGLGSRLRATGTGIKNFKKILNFELMENKLQVIPPQITLNGLFKMCQAVEKAVCTPGNGGGRAFCQIKVRSSSFSVAIIIFKI